MAKPKLLIVGPLPPPIGGVETVTKAVLESSAFSDFEVQHCNTTKKRPKDTQGRFDLQNYLWAARHMSRMAFAVATFRPDAIYMPVSSTWSGFMRDSMLSRIGKFGKAKVIGHVHGSWFGQILERKGKGEKSVRSSLARYDALLMLGEHWKSLVRSYGYEGKVFVVPSTLTKETFERGQAFVRRHKTVGEIIGLEVGQVGKRKGHFDLLRAMATIKEKKIPFRLIFVGPGELQGEYDQAVRLQKELGVEDVTEFTGSLIGDELYAQFKRADVFVMPSYDEGLPVVFFEAGAFEMPAIATPVGAIPELLKDGVNSMLVTPGDVPGICAAIEKMATQHGQRKQMALNLKHDIQAFHPDKVCAQIARVICEVLGTEEPGGSRHC